ncbi:MAG: DUF1186 domain-containing protein [Desulfobacteraceae bacterium]|nr:MAG: DUF1186 domain-containing protein [Desulfobacteraceae bacterium]
MENKNTDPIPVSEILAEFRFYDGNYKREQVDAAIRQKDEIIPHLIEILEDVLSHPYQYIEDENRHEYLYAFMLLGHFKAEEAHHVIADIFSLKDRIPDQLFDDLITENLPIVLLNTCGGSLDRIKSMILDKEVDEYCRNGANRALAYAVAAGYVSRKEVVEFFGQLFTGDEADEISDFWSMLAIKLVDLYPVEIIDAIRQAYEDGWISPGFVRFESFEKSLAKGEAFCLENLRRDFERQSIDDLHKSMSWWACFENKSRKSAAITAEQIQEQKKSQKKKAVDRKKKRKQEKKSRKKNRR